MPWDSQGRIRIPDHLLDKASLIDNLLEYAGLSGPVFMLGCTDRFELWRPDNRDSHKQVKETQSTLDHVAEELGF